MAMREMMKYGHRPGTGLRARSDGITEPIEPNGQKGREDIGYQPPMRKTCTDEEPDGKKLIHDIKRFLEIREYPENATNSQKRALRRLANYFFLNGEVLYRRTPDLESDSIRYVQRCHQCQIHEDFIRVPPNELNVMGLPWPFTAWGMDVIGPIDPAASNGHRFILVVIDYFTKWLEASSYKAVTKKVVADFV
ncbi:uncharacterized protein [Nicotiana tomentosiformis]|uniref:uncharacterized protein n=1 Tax=Nicotiana tomentosiformis TaxID=4098 RepID=UPI00388C8E00